MFFDRDVCFLSEQSNKVSSCERGNVHIEGKICKKGVLGAEPLGVGVMEDLPSV